MNNQPIVDSKSERGIALIVVLLLMAVLSGLATGFAMNGHVEAQMGQNEIYYAGARAAAEAGLNRAIVEIIGDTSHNLLFGPDGAGDDNPAAAVNADNGDISFLIGSSGPYALDAAGQYTYTIEVLDDDNDALYETALTTDQRTAMGENGIINNNANDRLILRATGYGPSGTTVRIARVLETVDTLHTTTTTTTTLSNPAFLVNGDLVATGNIHIQGTSGSVHANGNLTLTGTAADVSKDATATGTFTANQNWHAGGSQGGGRPTINVPDVHASDYISLADYKLVTVTNPTTGVQSGEIQTFNTSTNQWTACTTGACTSTGFTWSGGNWSITGNSAGAGTYYVEGDVTVSGSPNGGGNGNNATNLALSIIATGSINITGTPKFTPENTEKVQFVTDKDLTIGGNTDLQAEYLTVEGQIMVREQIAINGNPTFQGRVIVENSTSTGGLTNNTISGNPTIAYNGTLGAISTTTTTTTSQPTTYVNNVSGWMEQ